MKWLFNKYKNIVLPFDFKNNKEQILSVGDFIEQQGICGSKGN